MNHTLVIATRIDQLRRQRKISMQTLADQIGVSQPTVSRMLTGRQAISMLQLDRIAQALKVHPFALWTDQPLRSSRLLSCDDGTSPRLLGLTLRLFRSRTRLSLAIYSFKTRRT